MKKKCSGKEKKMKIRGMLSAYRKRKRYLLRFEFQNLQELKNLGPWKLIENFLILVLHCGK